MKNVMKIVKKALWLLGAIYSVLIAYFGCAVLIYAYKNAHSLTSIEWGILLFICLAVVGVFAVLADKCVKHISNDK